MDITKVDLYGMLEVSPDATLKEIKSAYRRKALKLHPDKNPNNPEAATLFNQLSEALKILLDETAKAAYDRVLKSKKEAEIRNSKLDATRKKFKDKLEAREKEHQLGLHKSRLNAQCLKLKWKIGPDEKEVYTREKLLSIFKEYGEISILIVQGKGSAIIEYYNKNDAEVAILVEKGYEKCPLKLAWVHHSSFNTFSYFIVT